MAFDTLHVEPQEGRPFPLAEFLHAFRGGVEDRFDIRPIHHGPVACIHRTHNVGVCFAVLGADSEFVVFDHKKDGKLLFLRETDRFKKISLAGGRFAE